MSFIYITQHDENKTFVVQLTKSSDTTVGQVSFTLNSKTKYIRLKK